ncbi:MAG: malto-oligosyltrehalose synthase [Sphingobium sp.]
MIPRATYRFQFHSGFTFADAEGIVPYLADLGISHVYASPVTVAAKGSMHGYDVTDPTRINPELGGEEGFRGLVAALRARGMGMVIDIVPNHMGVAGDGNRWWLDVLEKGEGSDFAAVFDIDWTGPIALPVLGAPLEEALLAGDIRLVEQEGRLGIRLYDGPAWPVRPDDPLLEDAKEARDAVLARHDPAHAAGRAALAALIGRQHYRLLYWRAANDSLNWRRFFSINDLAGVRMEDPVILALTHQLYFDLYRDGLIDGVRVDHVDGLADPAAYCRALRAAFRAIDPDRHAYIVVEKILAPREALPVEWETDGTSGYDFMREVSELLHDPSGQAPLGALWEEISGRSADFGVEALAARRDILDWQFEGQLAACIDSFHHLAGAQGAPWVTRGMIRRALRSLLHIFPVYRTYGTGTAAPPQDGPVRAAARQAALRIAAPGEAPVIDLILGWLAGEGKGEPELAREAVRRFQQLSAPIAAKGVEDTAFYRHGLLLSANDVGFDPGRLAAPVEAFHAAMAARAATHPHALLATATHDHKRGEDARARLAVLSAIPDIWRGHARRFMDLAAPYADGLDPADIYLLLQALVGAWKVPSDAFAGRVHDWQRKTLREAKLRSSWEAPDEGYEARYQALATALLTPGAAFAAAFDDFMAALAPAAEANSLVQTLLRCTVPGVPDLYQGCERADYSMVDPDNRRPVDYAARREALADGTDAKTALIAHLLSLRAERPRLFATGRYRPLPVTGERAAHVVAFEREGGDGRRLFCAAAIRLGPVLFGAAKPVPLPDWWGGTAVGGQAARDLFRDACVHVTTI